MTLIVSSLYRDVSAAADEYPSFSDIIACLVRGWSGKGKFLIAYEALVCRCGIPRLVRCQHNRALPEGDELWARLAHSPMLGQVGFELPAGRGRKARRVTQRIRAERIELDDGANGCLPVTCILAEEIDAPRAPSPWSGGC